MLSGIPASPGITMGEVFLLDKEEIGIKKRRLEKTEVEKEIQRFENALQRTNEELQVIKERIGKRIDPEQTKIFDAQLLILEDEVIKGEVERRIREEKINAEWIYKKTIEKTVNSISSSRDEYLKERVYDIEAVSERLLSNLLGKRRIALDKIKRKAVLMAHSLSPGDLVNIRKEKISGFATEVGGGTSHVALLAKSLGFPAVVGLKDALRRIDRGDFVIIDGDRGLVILSPTEKTVYQYEKRQKDLLKQKRKLFRLKSLPGETEDGRKIEIQANIELIEDIEEALRYGAEGIGLYRTEYLYLAKSELPSAQEQKKAYQTIVDKMYPNPVILRTFDLGGDKFAGEKTDMVEANPFLGWRAIRVCLDVPELFKVQLRAMLEASVRGNLKIMFPMVSGVEELKEAKSVLDQVKEELESQGIGFDQTIELGIMMEIPSACLMADSLATECDFFSIGTNDLIQYTLAVDRGNERVAHFYQSFHPSVLRLIKQTVEAAHRNGIWVGLCGEMAANPLATVLLVGMGIDELSTSPLSIPQIKRIVRSVNFSQAKEFAQKVLETTDLQHIKRLLEEDYKRRFGAEEIICLY
ncbi:MAG: hypothetical protein AMJ90_04700 [candidate division Zixibacteria bacterium SM23_73_2]|nr:MAG: hypothetical protein AMJ90_04700 [candidate division Zixibacteria bacterium SM23_73_2]